MTMPPMGSGDPFQDTGGDSVSARLSVDVPQDAANNLAQIVNASRDLATNMEAAARAQADFVEYLRQLPDVMAQSNAATQQFVQGAAPILTGGRSGGTWGRNDATRPDFTGQPGDGSNTEAREARQREALEDLRRNDPRQLANVIAQNSGDPRIIRRGGDDAQPPPPPTGPGSGSGRGGGGGGGAGSGPGGAPRPSGRPNGPTGPGRDSGGSSEEIDWTQRLQQMQAGSSQWFNNILAQTAAGGRAGGTELIASGIQGAQRMGTRASGILEQQIAAREATAAAEAEAQGMDATATASHIAAAGAPLRGLQGNLGTAARGLGVLGAGVGAIKGISSAGEWYQGMVAQGTPRGGGFQEGASFEMGVRVMAMNPFISTEQSRKIMMSALQNGYTGKEFDTVTEFMTENLRKMNMDTAESMKVLSVNVNKGGMSVAQAQRDITAVSNFAQDPNVKMTSGQMREQYIGMQDYSQNQFVHASAADTSALNQQLTSLGSTDPNLKGIGEVFLQGMTNNAALGRRINPDYHGDPAGALTDLLEQEGGGQLAKDRTYKVVKDIVMNPSIQQMMSRGTAGTTQALRIINARLAAFGINVPPGQLQPLVESIMSGDMDKEMKRSSDQVKKEQTGGEVKDKGFWGSIGSTFKAAGHAFNWADSSVTAFGEGLLGSDEKAEEHRKRRDSEWNKMLTDNAEETGYTNDRISGLMDQYGTNIKIKDKDGKEVKLDKKALANKDLMNRIVNGEAKLKLPGADDFVKLENMTGQEEEVSGDTGSGGGAFDLTERASQLLKLLPNGPNISQNQRSSDSSEDGASRNDPPAGSSYDNGGG